MWLRSGWGAADLSTTISLAKSLAIETKFNPNHDPQDGQFTSGSGASSLMPSVSENARRSSKPAAATPGVSTIFVRSVAFSPAADRTATLSNALGALNPIATAEAAPLRSPTAVSLAEHEAIGGHTIREHVGKSDSYILRRASTPTSTIDLGQIVIRRFPENVGTFSSLAVADKLVNATLSANRSVVAQVATGELGRAVLEAHFSGRPENKRTEIAEHRLSTVGSLEPIKGRVLLRARRGYQIDPSHNSPALTCPQCQLNCAD